MNQAIPLTVAVLLALGLSACVGENMESEPVRQSEEKAMDQDNDEGVMVGKGNRDPDPQVDEASRTALVADNRDFAFVLFDQLREIDPEANLFLSPYSISMALAMVYAGAREETRGQIAQVMNFGLDDEKLHPAFNWLDQALAARADHDPEEEGKAFELAMVNQTWGQADFNFQREYLDQLVKHYGAMIRLVDFENEFESIRREINAWVEEQTNDRIEDLLPPDSLNAETRFVLVNAIYFLASWKNAFEEDDTADAPFVSIDGSEVNVPMMRQTENLGLYQGNETVAVSMPYVGEEVSLVALMPDDAGADFRQWEAQMDRESFDRAVAGLRPGRVSLHFPRFETDSEIALSEQLENLGMSHAFDECLADFSGISGSPPCIPGESIYIDEVFHKSFINVNEAGTEAAAATAVVMMETTAMRPPPTEIRFDRPFLYAIYDHPTETILFLGRMLKP